MKKKQSPDPLSKAARAARDAGMFYGKYMGLQFEQQKRMEREAAGYRRCCVCGHEFRKRFDIQTMCSPECGIKFIKSAKTLKGA